MGIASLGGATLDNEENYLIKSCSRRWARSRSRIRRVLTLATVPVWGELGRRAATDYQQDLVNADCVIIMGSNMAEAYPVGFQWVMKAKARGAPLIHIDPRFTPTSALADRHVTLRAGTDIAFLGGVINYILSNGLEFRRL
jgi:formate dehydrogenase major subunit